MLLFFQILFITTELDVANDLQNASMTRHKKKCVRAAPFGQNNRVNSTLSIGQYNITLARDGSSVILGQI